MYSLIRSVDALLNRVTMYLLLEAGLVLQLILADVLAFTGHIGIGPAALLISAVVLGVCCFGTNYLIGTFLKVPRNRESALITALILVFIMPPATNAHNALLLALTGMIAMASKYVIAYRGSNIINPAVAAAVVMTMSGLLPAIWWVATPVLVPFSIALGLVILRKQRKFSIFLSFIVGALAMLLFIGLTYQNNSIGTIMKSAFTAFPLLFMGTIMLTEPSTMPRTRYYQVLEGLLVGCLFASQLRSGRFATTPENALLAGNVFAFVVMPAAGYLVRLKEKIQLAPDIYELIFTQPADRKIAFAPGQYMEWTLPSIIADARGNRRSFSMASAPSELDVRIGIRVVPDGGSSFKRKLLALKPGEHIRASHVAGDFILPIDSAQPLLFIAGGIGITPIRSMLQSIVDSSVKRDVTVLYFANDKPSFIYQDVLKRAQAKGIKVHLKLGRLTSAELEKLIPDVRQRLTYISGPPTMVDGYKRGLRNLGVSARRIKTDHFSGY